MSRYIDVDKLMNDVDRIDISYGTDIDDIIFELEKIIHKQPTADVAEVIRCKDCMFYTPYELEGYEGLGDCSQLLGLEFCVENDFFCGYGARMDGETE